MILITGAAGYIGSHCALNLLENGYNLVLFDNLDTGNIETVEILKNLDLQGQIADFIEGDLKNFDEINAVFKKYQIKGVIHFAANSVVEESIKNPQKYYENNVFGSQNLLKAMIDNNVLKIVFSSSAAVYGITQDVYIDENFCKNPINPYGESKLQVENILCDYSKTHGLQSVIFRYFNVAGADSLVRIGENHNPETHLIPNLLKATLQDDVIFELFGDDHKTFDGTCIRDYVNVEDLAEAHRLGVEKLFTDNISAVYNLGTQDGFSVKEILNICAEITQKNITCKLCPKRIGDPPKLVANSQKAQKELNWVSKRTIFDTIKSAYEWEKRSK